MFHAVWRFLSEIDLIRRSGHIWYDDPHVRHILVFMYLSGYILSQFSILPSNSVLFAILFIFSIHSYYQARYVVGALLIAGTIE
jgi:hypothetical protein